jgi:hypothetical protein
MPISSIVVSDLSCTRFRVPGLIMVLNPF